MLLARRLGAVGSVRSTASITLRTPSTPAGPRVPDSYLSCADEIPAAGVDGCNVPESLRPLIARGLHLRPHHPLGIIRERIRSHFDQVHTRADGSPLFSSFDTLSPIVTSRQNFDTLLTPADHPSRSPSDTYYVGGGKLLRCHTSAHQAELLSTGERAFLVSGDVYRRDTVDRTHYPVFHQMEGVRTFAAGEDGPTDAAGVTADLQSTLEGLVRTVFGDVSMRWVDATFPFTDPSLELEIYYGGEWLEVLGCGNIQPEILRRAGYEVGRDGPGGWAFGLGLERLAMVLFGIPDIRLFWTADERFTSQFRPGEITRFEPYSKFPPCYKDVSFWVNDASSSSSSSSGVSFHENDVHEIARGVAGDLCESVEAVDEFVHPKTGRRSICFRINYRSMDRSLTNEEVDELQFRIRDMIATQLPVELR